MKLGHTKDRKNLPLEGGNPQFHGPYPSSRCQPTRQKNCTRGSPKHGNSSSSCNSWRPSKPSATAQPSALICPPASFASPSQTWKTIPSASRSCDSPGIASLTSWGFPQTSRSLFRPATGRATGFRAMCPGLPKLGEGLGSGAAPPRLTENSQRPLGNPPRGTLLEGVLVQTARGIGDNGIWRIAKLNGILYLLDVGSKTTSFSCAFAGIFASN